MITDDLGVADLVVNRHSFFYNFHPFNPVNQFYSNDIGAISMRDLTFVVFDICRIDVENRKKLVLIICLMTLVSSQNYVYFYIF